MSHRSFLALVLLSIVALALTGCAPAATPAPATAVAQAAGTVEEKKSEFALVNTEWQLESMFGPQNAVPAVPGSAPTLGFAVDRYSGFGGCDWFLGTYVAQAANELHMNAPSITKGGCLSEPAAASQQSTYMSALWNVVNYKVDSGKLLLYTTDNQLLLTMKPLEALPLEGTTWDLSLYFSKDFAYWTSIIPGTTITAKFDGQNMTGNAGCNDYSAPYKLAGDRLEIGKYTVTGNTCSEPAGVMDQQQAYLAALEKVGPIQKFPRSLEFFTKDGKPGLAFHGQTPPGQ